jgi:hypothetical protein
MTKKKEKPASMTRSEVVKIRLTQAEKNKLVELSRELNMDLSQCVRSKVFKDSDTLMISSRDFRLATDNIGAQLGKIGSNINQFARYANSLYNSGQVDPLVLDQFRAALLEYKGEKDKLISVYTALLKSKKL